MQDKLTDLTRLDNQFDHKRLVGSKVRIGPREQVDAKPKPQISVQKVDGRVQSLLITCACGEQITVVCEYAE